MNRAIVLVTLLSALPGAAAAQTIGPFTPDARLEATVSAHPEFDWSSRTGEDGSADALAERTLPFAGLDWEVALSRYPGTRYAFSMTAFDEKPGKAACFERFGQVVAALEPIYGRFGRHPAFARENNGLYGFAFSLPGVADRPTFRLHEVGAGSLAREDLAWPAIVTFAEIDPAEGETVAFNAGFNDGDSVEGKALGRISGCSLKIEIFQSDERAARVRALEAPAP